MAITATVSITTSVATVSSLAGGTLLTGMTMTYSAQTQPVSPAVSLGTQISGSTGSNGTYNVNNLTTLGSSTVTFELLKQITNQMQPVPNTTQATNSAPTVGGTYTLIPPPPLPETLIGSTTQTSYST